MAEEDKKEMLKLQGFYVGKEFIKKGNKNGKDWSMFKLLVKEKMEDKFSKKITMFQGLKGFEEITEGDFISVGYVLSEPYEITTDKGEKKMIQSKTALWVGKSDENAQNTTTEPQQPTTQPSQTANKPDLSNFDVFKAKYMELVKNAQIKPSAIHMLGSWINSNEKDRVTELKAKCEESIK